MANSNLFLEHILIEISWFSSQQPKKNFEKIVCIIFPLNSIKRIGDCDQKDPSQKYLFQLFLIIIFIKQIVSNQEFTNFMMYLIDIS